jgi:hypothetical protein
MVEHNKGVWTSTWKVVQTRAHWNLIGVGMTGPPACVIAQQYPSGHLRLIAIEFHQGRLRRALKKYLLFF